MKTLTRNCTTKGWGKRLKGVTLGVIATALASSLLPVSAQAQQTVGAQQVQSLPMPRNLHGSVVVGDYLHIISGDEPMPSGFTNEIISAKINDDHTLQPWFKNKPLPINLIYIGNNVMVLDQYFYIVGGQEVSDIPGAADPGSNYNHAPNNSAVYARVDPQGRIGEWKRSSRWNGDNGMGAAAATDGRYLYAIGGTSDASSHPMDLVCFAPILGTGDVGNWSITSKLPTPLTNHSAYFHNGSIYTLGGRTSAEVTSVTNKVYVTEVLENGQLTPWRVSPMRLAYPVELASACAADDWLFMFCGRSPEGKDSMIRAIQFSKLTSQGISPWGQVATSITARSYSSAALDPKRRAVFISGGRFANDYRTLNEKVFAFPLVPSSGEATPEVAQDRSNTFLDHNRAFAEAQTTNKNLFLFIYSDRIEFSKNELANLSNSGDFVGNTNDYILGMLNVREEESFARQHSVIRVPTYMIMDPSGKVIKKTSGKKTKQDLLNFIR